MELLSRENAAADSCQNKLEYRPTVWLFYVFLMVLGWRWSSAAQRHKLQAVAAQTALVSRINSLRFFGLFLMGFVVKIKNDDVTPT